MIIIHSFCSNSSLRRSRRWSKFLKINFSSSLDSRLSSRVKIIFHPTRLRRRCCCCCLDLPKRLIGDRRNERADRMNWKMPSLCQWIRINALQQRLEFTLTNRYDETSTSRTRVEWIECLEWKSSLRTSSLIGWRSSKRKSKLCVTRSLEKRKRNVKRKSLRCSSLSFLSLWPPSRLMVQRRAKNEQTFRRFVSLRLPN